MLANNNNPIFDRVMCVFSGLSVICTIAVLIAARVPREGGPEPSARELMLLVTFVAQLGAFLLCVIMAVVVAGFGGGLRLRRVTAGLSLAAICGLLLEHFVMHVMQ